MNNLETILVCPTTKKPLININKEFLQSSEGRKYPILKEGMYCLLPDEQISDSIWDKGIKAFKRRGTGTSWAYNHWHDLGLKSLIGNITDENILLSFGSGDVKEKKALEEMGYTIVALDIDPMEGVNVVADGHSLPFADNSFDTITSFEVLEHIKHPWVVVKELNRVLKPGGRFIGSVAFLKPFHYSYFHMTHHGVTELLNYGGFKITKIYGGQNFMATLVRLSYPLGPNKFSMRIYDIFFKIMLKMRGILWSIVKKKSPKTKMNIFDDKYSFSYNEWLTISNAGCIIFESINEKSLEN